MNRHYEIVFLVHPRQSEQVPAMVERYQSLITEAGGQIHRMEDWGRRLLAYPIKKAYKAHYILMNIECNTEALNQLTENFRFNDAVIRNLVIRRDQAVVKPSFIAESTREQTTVDQSKQEASPQETSKKETDSAPEVSKEEAQSTLAEEVENKEEPSTPEDPVTASDENS